MIWHHQPYDPGKNIGQYYNAAMDRVGPRDWVCFTDADAVFTTSDYGTQINDILRENPKYGLLYAVANRIGCEWQVARELNAGSAHGPALADWNDDDMAHHRAIGLDLQAKQRTRVVDMTPASQGGSGFLILVSKSAWERAGGFREFGMLHVDWSFFEAAKAAGVKVGLMAGLYLYHWYRGGNRADTSHLL